MGRGASEGRRKKKCCCFCASPPPPFWINQENVRKVGACKSIAFLLSLPSSSVASFFVCRRRPPLLIPSLFEDVLPCKCTPVVAAAASTSMPFPPSLLWKQPKLCFFLPTLPGCSDEHALKTPRIPPPSLTSKNPLIILHQREEREREREEISLCSFLLSDHHRNSLLLLLLLPCTRGWDGGRRNQPTSQPAKPKRSPSTNSAPPPSYVITGRGGLYYGSVSLSLSLHIQALSSHNAASMHTEHVFQFLNSECVNAMTNCPAKAFPFRTRFGKKKKEISNKHYCAMACIFPLFLRLLMMRKRGERERESIKTRKTVFSFSSSSSSCAFSSSSDCLGKGGSFSLFFLSLSVPPSYFSHGKGEEKLGKKQGQLLPFFSLSFHAPLGSLPLLSWQFCLCANSFSLANQ